MKNIKTIRFDYSFMGPDQRPRIIAMGISGKTAWISVEYGEKEFCCRVSKTLIKQLKSIYNK